MPLLPDTADPDALRAAMREDAPWRAAMRAIAERHGFPRAPHVRPKTGSSVVFFLGEDHVAKLYAPMWRAQLDAEEDVLPRVHGRLGVETPELVAHGEIEGWPYIVMRRLSGTPLLEAWDRIDAGDLRAIFEALGRTLGAIHRIDAGGLRLLAPEWPALVDKKLAAAGDDAREFLAPFVDDMKRAPCVLVHADVTRDHVLVGERGGHVVMTGLFDFADARLAPREYDLAGPAAFLVRGDPTLARALLRGLGVAEEDMTDSLALRVFAFELVHLWADLTRDAAMVGVSREAGLPALARAFWPIAPR